MKTQTASTTALKVLNVKGVSYSLHEFEHDPAARRYGTEAADKLGVEYGRVFKTLMILVDGKPVIALVPVSGQLDLKAAASIAGGRKAQLAGVAETERRTGFTTGGVSPFGQRRQHPVIADRTISDYATVFVSAGKRGLQVEMQPEDVVSLTQATIGRIATLD